MSCDMTINDVCERIIEISQKKDFSIDEFLNTKIGKGYINHYNNTHPQDTRDFSIEKLIDIINFKCSNNKKTFEQLKKNLN